MPTMSEHRLVWCYIPKMPVSRAFVCVCVCVCVCVERHKPTNISRCKGRTFFRHVQIYLQKEYDFVCC